LDFLVQKGKPQVEFSELGNLIPFAKFGYPKLKEYIHDAQSAGLVRCGNNKNIHWVSLVLANHDRMQPLGQGTLNGSVPVSRGPTDRKQVRNCLITALESLKKDYFKPTEGTLQKRVKQMSLPLQKIDWEEIISIAKAYYFTIEGEKPNRVIYPPTGPFDGVDPSHPCSDKFSPALWKSLQQFLLNVHPVVRVGRYGFASFLHEEGPMEIREMPLGTVTELVQLSLHRHLLKYHKTQVSTISHEEMLTYTSNTQNSTHDYDEFRPTSPNAEVPDEDDVIIDPERERLVPVRFTWPYPGKSVLVTGSFLNWRGTIALQSYESELGYGVNSGEVNGVDVFFSTDLYLPPGKYEYKFVVDGAWHYDPKQPVVTDETGNLNNFVVVEPLPITRTVESNDGFSY